MRCRIIKNTLLPTAFSAILPAGFFSLKMLSIKRTSERNGQFYTNGARSREIPPCFYIEDDICCTKTCSFQLLLKEQLKNLLKLVQVSFSLVCSAIHTVSWQHFLEKPPKLQKKAVRKSVFLTIQRCILKALSAKITPPESPFTEMFCSLMLQYFLSQFIVIWSWKERRLKIEKAIFYRERLCHFLGKKFKQTLAYLYMNLLTTINS